MPDFRGDGIFPDCDSYGHAQNLTTSTEEHEITQLCYFLVLIKLYVLQDLEDEEDSDEVLDIDTQSNKSAGVVSEEDTAKSAEVSEDTDEALLQV